MIERVTVIGYLGSWTMRRRWEGSGRGSAGKGRDGRGCAVRGPGEQEDDWGDVGHRYRGQVVA